MQPQFGGAKDPVNYAGMIAANHLRGDLPLADWQQLAADRALLVDVRDADEFETGHVPGAINLPLNQIRHRLDELPRDREVWLYCGVGQRAYYATRVLLQNGFRVKNLSGGFRTYNLITSSVQRTLTHRARCATDCDPVVAMLDRFHAPLPKAHGLSVQLRFDRFTKDFSSGSDLVYSDPRTVQQGGLTLWQRLVRFLDYPVLELSNVQYSAPPLPRRWRGMRP